MKKIFYRDKTVVFGESNELAEQTSVAFRTISSIEYLCELLQHCSTLYIRCDCVEESMEEFTGQFSEIKAGGGVVRNISGETLMIHRNGCWDLPKGKLEQGETIEQCALREVEEECGVESLELGELITVTQHIYNLYGGWYIKSTYWFEMTTHYQGELLPQAEEGIDEVRWVGTSELVRNIKSSYSTIYEVIKLHLTNN